MVLVSKRKRENPDLPLTWERRPYAGFRHPYMVIYSFAGVSRRSQQRRFEYVHIPLLTATPRGAMVEFRKIRKTYGNALLIDLDVALDRIPRRSILAGRRLDRGEAKQPRTSRRETELT